MKQAADRSTLRNWKRMVPLVFWLASRSGRAEDAPVLANLSFEELSQIKIVTASRTPEPLWGTAAAVAVLTPEDVARAGATSIPEALRWVPGLNVAQITANSWAVGARGFQWQYANKLLVMIDGRSVYSPTLGGVRWEDNTAFLADLDRIEVVRGPGASTWGANAVNGVINIVSRSAFDTLGPHVFAGTGDELQAYAGARYGWKVSDNAAVRLYGMYRQADDNVLPAGASADDGAQFGQGGFRLDWRPSEQNAATLQGDFFAQRTEYVRTFPTLTAPPAYSILSTDPIKSHGANLLGRWRHEWSDETYVEWQNYWDWHQLDRPQTGETVHTLDTDLVFGTTLGQRHELTAGLGYRYMDGEMEPIIYNFSPARFQTHLFRTFVQDQITLVPERWVLSLGTKLEHNDLTGWELQPTARLAFTPTVNVSLWGSVSRAVRTPTWAEEAAAIDARVFPPGVLDPLLPATIRLFGNPDLQAERLMAYELGARWKAAERVTLDAAVFYYDYEDYVLASFISVTNQISPPAQVNAAGYQNGIRGESYGGELAVRWKPADWWQLQASYSYVQIELRTRQSDPFQYVQDEDTTPHHTARLQSVMHFGPRWELDLGGRYVDTVPYYSIADYFELDARLAWKPNPRWQLALVGHNLLHGHHPEYDSALDRRLTEIERSVFVLLDWKL